MSVFYIKYRNMSSALRLVLFNGSNVVKQKNVDQMRFVDIFFFSFFLFLILGGLEIYFSGNNMSLTP